MANISVTSRCNRNCSFCFAPDAAPASGDEHMTPEVFERALDFLTRSNVGEARLLGGEPTLHPEFPALVEAALRRGLKLVLFSGGLVPEKVLALLERLSPETMSLLLNVPLGEEAKEPVVRRQRELMARLGPRVILGVTIATPGIEIDFLLDLIDDLGLRRLVRLGIAHPRLGEENEFLHPRHYPEVGARVAAFGLTAAARGIELEFDCGWVPCMFPDGALAALGKGPDQVGLRCSPILDLLPGGQVISCYPLAEHHQEPLTATVDGPLLRARFAEQQRPHRAVMLYKHCTECDFRRRGACTGGCLSGSLRRVRGADGPLVPLRRGTTA